MNYATPMPSGVVGAGYAPTSGYGTGATFSGGHYTYPYPYTFGNTSYYITPSYYTPPISYTPTGSYWNGRGR